MSCHHAETRFEQMEAARLVAGGLREIVEGRIDEIVSALSRTTRIQEDRFVRRRLYREFDGLSANLEKLKETEAEFAGLEDELARQVEHG